MFQFNIMQSTITIVGLIITSYNYGLVSGGGLELPSYISKCSLSDPKLNDCIKEKANAAIPTLVKGDASLGVPATSPLSFKEAPVVGESVIMVVFDTYTDDIKNLRLTDVNFDLDNGKVTFRATLPHLILTAKNYTISRGTILDIPTSGHGKINMTLEECNLEYNADIRVYKKNGDEYIEFTHSNIDTVIKQAYYYFENIKSPEKADVNAYIAENWEKFRDQLKPMVRTYWMMLIHFPLNSIFTKVPMSKIFLP